MCVCVRLVERAGGGGPSLLSRGGGARAALSVCKKKAREGREGARNLSISRGGGAAPVRQSAAHGVEAERSGGGGMRSRRGGVQRGRGAGAAVCSRRAKPKRGGQGRAGKGEESSAITSPIRWGKGIVFWGPIGHAGGRRAEGSEKGKVGGTNGGLLMRRGRAWPCANTRQKRRQREGQGRRNERSKMGVSRG